MMASAVSAPDGGSAPFAPAPNAIRCWPPIYCRILAARLALGDTSRGRRRFDIGVRARPRCAGSRARCRPGPRCSRVRARLAPSARSPSSAPVRDAPRRSRARVHLGTSSSASTKCHRPRFGYREARCPTAVRDRGCVRITACALHEIGLLPSVERFRALSMPFGRSRPDPLHQGILFGSSTRESNCFFSLPMPVLVGDRAAHPHSAAMIACITRCRMSSSGWKNREMDVAVAPRARRADERILLGSGRVTACKILRHRRARGNASRCFVWAPTPSRPRRLLAPLPGARPERVGKDEHVRCHPSPDSGRRARRRPRGTARLDVCFDHTISTRSRPTALRR